MDDCNKLFSQACITREFFTCLCSFACETLALDVNPHVVSNLQFGSPVDFLPGETTVAQELAIKGFHYPKAIPMLCIVIFIPRDPSSGLFAGLCGRIVGHDKGVTEQRSHVVEVCVRHLSESNPDCFFGKHSYSLQTSLMSNQEGRLNL